MATDRRVIVSKLIQVTVCKMNMQHLRANGSASIDVVYGCQRQPPLANSITRLCHEVDIVRLVGWTLLFMLLGSLTTLKSDVLDQTHKPAGI